MSWQPVDGGDIIRDGDDDCDDDGGGGDDGGDDDCDDVDGGDDDGGDGDGDDDCDGEHSKLEVPPSLLNIVVKDRQICLHTSVIIQEVN